MYKPRSLYMHLFKIHPPSWLSLLSHAQWFVCSSYDRLALQSLVLCLLMNKDNILSTRKESPFLRKSRPCLPVRTHFPHHSCDAYNDYSHDCGVRFPVWGLWVPATCWRPDVLGVSWGWLGISRENCVRLTYGILPPPPCAMLVTIKSNLMRP
jgi:hypothetical protein